MLVDRLKQWFISGTLLAPLCAIENSQNVLLCWVLLDRSWSQAYEYFDADLSAQSLLMMILKGVMECSQQI